MIEIENEGVVFQGLVSQGYETGKIKVEYKDDSGKEKIKSAIGIKSKKGEVYDVSRLLMFQYFLTSPEWETKRAKAEGRI